MRKATTSFYNKYTNTQWLFIFVTFLFILKLSLLPFVHAVDADGITRVLMAKQWTENPSVIKAGNWPPLYFYLMGMALKIYNNQFYAPIVVTIFLSIGTLFPLYFLMRRLLNESTALLMCIVFSLSPIVFRVSLLALSETPSIFFIILAANVVAKGLMEKSNRQILFAGLLMSIAGGFRYESWIISPFVALIIAYRYSFKQALIFIFPALLFPLYWIASNYFSSDTLFSSFTWAADGIKSNTIHSFEDLLRRIWWYPVSLVFVFGPVGFYFFLKEAIIICRNRKTNRTAFLFFLLFIGFLIFFLVNCLSGSLLTQHRFTLTLYLLAFPFIGFYFRDHTEKKLKMALVISLSSFALSFIYNSSGIRPVPRLKDHETEKVAAAIKNNSSPTSGLIIDSWGFENTYYLAFMSGLPQQSIAVFDDNPNSVSLELGHAIAVFNEHPKGLILFHKNGKLAGEMRITGNELLVKSTGQRVMLELVLSSGEIILYKYQSH